MSTRTPGNAQARCDLRRRRGLTRQRQTCGSPSRSGRCESPLLTAPGPTSANVRRDGAARRCGERRGVRAARRTVARRRTAPARCVRPAIPRAALRERVCAGGVRTSRCEMPASSKRRPGRCRHGRHRRSPRSTASPSCEARTASRAAAPRPSATRPDGRPRCGAEGSEPRRDLDRRLRALGAGAAREPDLHLLLVRPTGSGRPRGPCAAKGRGSRGRIAGVARETRDELAADAGPR